MTEDDKCNEVSENLYNNLLNKNIEVLYDDRKFNMGKKLSDNDLIGIPYQVIIGKRDLKDNIVQLKNRLNNETKKISPEEALNFLLEQTLTDF
jgi:prolyl-tRNA synthetase